MKRSGECPKCQSRRIGRLASVVDDGTATATRRLAKLRGKWLLTYAGDVEAYVCTDCGYFEEHVIESDLRSIEWEKLDGFEWHSPSRGNPFR